MATGTRPLNQEVIVTLLRVADRARRDASRVLDTHDLTPQQYNVLRILRGAGDAGLPTLAVAERMVEQTPGITRLMDRLEAKGYIRRERCMKDRRQHLCWITAEGARLLDELAKPMLAAHDDTLDRLAANERQTLLKLLGRVLEREG